MPFDLCHPVKRWELIGFLLQLVLVLIEECWFPHILRCWYAPQTLATPFSSHQRKLPVKGQVMNHLKNALNDIQHTWRLFRLCYWIVNVGIFDCFTSGMFHNWKGRSHDQLLLSTRKNVSAINNTTAQEWCSYNKAYWNIFIDDASSTSFSYPWRNFWNRFSSLRTCFIKSFSWADWTSTCPLIMGQQNKV